MRVKPSIGFTVIAVAIAVGVGWALGRSSTEDDAHSMALAHELEVIGLCANSLNTLSAEDGSKASILLVERLESGVRRAHGIASTGVRIEQPVPNLYEGLRRSADTLRKLEKHSVADTAEELYKEFQSDVADAS